jgi:HTH-type transcriptional regulator / antitoxin HipB
MKDIRTLTDLGEAVQAARRAAGVTTVDVARLSGHSRDVLHRLENGQDVSVSSLLGILAAIGQRLEIAPAARPDLADMQRRFAHLLDEAPPAAGSASHGTGKPRQARPRRRG